MKKKSNNLVPRGHSCRNLHLKSEAGVKGQSVSQVKIFSKCAGLTRQLLVENTAEGERMVQSDGRSFRLKHVVQNWFRDSGTTSKLYKNKFVLRLLGGSVG